MCWKEPEPPPLAAIAPLRAELLARAPDPDFVRYGRSFAAVEALGAELAAAVLWEDRAIDRDVHTRAGLARRLGVTEARSGLWRALLDLLAAAGLVRLEGDLVRRLARARPRAVLEREAADLAAAEPAMAPFLDLLGRTTAALPAVLRGELAGTAVLFPEGRLDLVERIYARNPLADHYNALMARAVRALAEARLARLPAGTPLQVLEVGAGTGGATESILAALAELGPRVRYLYTDVSLGFLQHGHTRFGSARVEPVLLDIARPGEPQGIATGSADLVVAANVLHATPDLAATLGHLWRLIAPSGALALNEVTAVQSFATLTFGLTEEWWGFRDAASRLPGAPLLDVARWRTALAAAGFPETVALGLPGQADEAATGQAIILARRDQRAAEPAPTGPRKGWPPAASPAPQAAAEQGGDVEDLLARDLAEILSLPPSSIDRRGRFMDYGVDSILGVSFVTKLNQRFGLDLKPTTVFAYPTVKDLARHLRQDLGIAARPEPGPAPRPPQPTAEPIAVIGMAARFADADDLEAFHDLLASGRSGIGDVSARFGIDPDDPPPHLRAAAPYLRHAGALPRIDLFDPMFFRISGREAELTDPQHRVFLMEAWRALEHAGYGGALLDGANCGVFVGCHGGDYTHRMAELGVVPDSYAFMGNAASILAARIAYILNLKGPALAVDTACSSSLVAVHLACQSLRAGECEVALAGGVFLNTTAGFNVAAASAGMLSPRGRCATFDAEADGFVPGEGAGAVILKPLSRAIADGDRVIATILGSAVNQDGRTSGITAPSPLAQAEVIHRAQELAGVSPAEVSYVETHGTGTRLGDPIEVEGLTRAFAVGDPPARRCALGSVKTNIGHAAHAAGIAGLLKTLLSFERDELYPSLHFRRENPVLDLAKTPFAVQTGRAPWPRPEGGRRVAGVSSFGFSGTNGHLVLADPPADERPPREPPPAGTLFLLSAPTATGLARRVRDLAAWLDRHGQIARPDDVAFTLSAGRSHFDQRLALIAGSLPELRRLLDREPAAGDLLTAASDACALEAIARRYLVGEEVDLRPLLPAARRVPLPSYPFELGSYWIEPREAPQPQSRDEVALPPLLAPRWVELPPESVRPAGPARLHVLGGTAESGALIAALRAHHQAATELRADDPPPPVGEPILVPVPRTGGSDGLRPLFELVGRLTRARGGRHEILVIHDGRPEAAAAAAFAPSLRFIAAPVGVRSLEAGGDPAALAAALPAVLASPESELRLDAAGRLHRRELLPCATTARRSAEPKGGVWLLTGGLGGLGPRFARHLALTRGAKVALIGRSPLDGARRARLDELRRAGVDAAYASADVAEPPRLAAAVAELERALGPVTAVLHAAGLPGGAVIGEKGWPEIAPVLRAKIDGARALDELLAGRELQAFVLFSSLAAAFGDFGQCDYAVANAAHGRFAAWRAAEVRVGRRHGRTLAIAWPIWAGGHEALSAEGAALFSEALGMPFLDEAAGLAAFEAGLASAEEHPEIMVTTTGSVPRPAATPRPTQAAADDPTAAIQQRLVALIAAQQRLDPARLKPTASLAEFGFDSIGLKELAARLSEAFGVEITPAVFFAHGSIAALARHLRETHPAAVGTCHGASTPAPASALPATPAEPDAIAIIGMAGRFPGASDLAAFWRLIETGGVSVTPMPPERRDLLGLPAGPGEPALTAGFLDEVDRFDHQLFHISRRDAVHMDPQHRLALEAVWRALEDAAVRPGDTAGRPVGVFFGQQVNAYAGLLSTDEEARPQLALGNIAAMLPGRISYAFDWQGPSEAVDTACSSGLVAVHRAVRALRSGECELAVAGAVSLLLDPEDLVTTDRLGVLSPDGRCHSFDARANGYVKGEGVGVVLLKPLARALADGDPIRAVIRGSAVNHGGRAQSLTAPNPLAQAALIRAALADARVPPAGIGYLEAHGTGTELGDPVELEGLRTAFADGPAPGACALGTVKANIGHLEPAAGIAGLIKTVLALQHRVRPALAGFERPNPYLKLDGSPFAIPHRSEPWPADNGPRRAGVSSFGFSGSNAHVIAEEPPAIPPARPANADGPILLPFAAFDPGQLATLIEAHAAALRGRPAPDLRDVALTLMLGRDALPCRAVLLADPAGDPAGGLDALAAHLRGRGEAPAQSWTASGGTEGAFGDDPDDLDYLAGLCRRGRLDRLARLWCAGAGVDWRRLAPFLPWTAQARRVALPGLPLRRTRCWGELRRGQPAAALAAVTAPPPAVPPPEPPPRPAATAAAATAILAQVREVVAQALYLEPEDLGETASFAELGLDSILAVEVAKAINDRFGTDLQATRLYDHPSVKALAAHLAERMAAGPLPSPGAIPAPPPPDGRTREVLDFLRAALAEALDLTLADVPADTPLDRLAVVPEAAARILAALNERFATSLGPAELGPCRDLEAVARLVAGRTGAAAGSPPAPPPPSREADPEPSGLAWLRAELADLLFLAPDALSPDQSPAEQGLDLVLATELADRLARRLGEGAPDPRALMAAPSLRALAATLNGRRRVEPGATPATHALPRLVAEARRAGFVGPLEAITWLGPVTDAAPLAAELDADAAELRLVDDTGEARVRACVGRVPLPPPPDLDRGLIDAASSSPEPDGRGPTLMRLPANAEPDESGLAPTTLAAALDLLGPAPRAIGRLSSFAPMTGELVAWAIPEPPRAAGGGRRADLLIADTSGRIVLELRGCELAVAEPPILLHRPAAAPPPAPPRYNGVNGGHAPPAAARVREIVEAQIRAVLPDLPPDAIRPGITLAALGANSIDRAEVAAGAMEALDLAVPPGELAAVACVDSLIELLARHLGQAAAVHVH